MMQLEMLFGLSKTKIKLADPMIPLIPKEAALKDADALVICTEWQNFRAADLGYIKEELKAAVVFDGRNMYEPDKMKNLGLDYYSIGRGLSISNSQI